MVIFINDSRLVLSDKSDVLNLTDFALHVNYLGRPKFLMQYIDLLEKSPDAKSVLIYSADVKKLIADFESLYKIIEAAGGLVFNENREVLLMFRRGFWDLPKGKIDAGETPEEAAVREVQEETGISEVKIKDFYRLTYHTYTQNSKRILKKTYWYLMHSTASKLTPQTEEDIEIVEFVEIYPFLATHPKIFGNILELLTDIVQ